MRNHPITILIGAAVFLVMPLSPAPPAAFAHCDGLDGPVVTAARKALDTGNVNLILIWVQKENEPEIKAAFLKTLEVRKLNAQARDLADMFFFETLVRIHRAGEGAPYTGLKPAGRDPGPWLVLCQRMRWLLAFTATQSSLSPIVISRIPCDHAKVTDNSGKPALQRDILMKTNSAQDIAPIHFAVGRM